MTHPVTPNVATPATASNGTPGIAAVVKAVWQDFRRARRALFIFEILFKLFEAWLFVPAIAVLLAVVLARAGRVAVSNWDILDFLRTPLGVLYAALSVTLAVALLLLEQAGIIVLAHVGRYPERPPVTRMLQTAVGKMLRVVQLGAVKAALLALTFLPFVLLALLAYALLLTGHDIYFYVSDRPPVFWVAAGIGVVLLLAAAAVGAALFVRWAFALPILLFENQPPRAALRASGERVRGVAWRIGVVLIGWQLVTVLFGAVLLAGFRLVAAAVLARSEESRWAIILLLVAQGGLLATISFAGIIGQGLFARRLYLIRSAQLGQAGAERPEDLSDSDASIPPWNWRLALLTMPLFLLAPLAVWFGLPQYVEAGATVKVTAHRGHSRAAPENTLSAIRKAIESKADYAEIDVQQTADGVVVLLHDRDLKRVAGLSRRLDELTYDEVRKLDVGSWFDPSFADERIPTLAEAIELARGKIKLNIEMKYFGPDQGLAEAVARLLVERNFEADCIITSFNYDALRTVKQHNPPLRTGLIVAQVLGDVNRLDVDALSVQASSLTDEMLRDAHRAGREVHVWTVNEPREITQMMSRGVDNLITNDPDLAIRRRAEWAGMSGAERLLVASRVMLGLDP
jgi:glycerophosphoryl diester phosphodiesterase